MTASTVAKSAGHWSDRRLGDGSGEGPHVPVLESVDHLARVAAMRERGSGATERDAPALAGGAARDAVLERGAGRADDGVLRRAAAVADGVGEPREGVEAGRAQRAFQVVADDAEGREEEVEEGFEQHGAIVGGCCCLSAGRGTDMRHMRCGRDSETSAEYAG